jgi:predicted MFS family arabinose efflux permease
MVIPLYWFLVPSPEYDSMEIEVVNNCLFSDISFRNLDIDDTDSNDGISEKAQNRCSMLMKIWNAFFIPGVSVYSLAFAMSKDTNYIYLYWLPYMMTNLKGLSDSQAAYVSTLFDAGAFVGSICAGLLIDYFQKNDIILVYFALNASLSFLLLLPSVTGFTVMTPTLFCLGFFVGVLYRSYLYALL